MGADAVRIVVERNGQRLRPSGRDRAEVAEGRLGEVTSMLAVPTTFMNESGEAIGRLVGRCRLDDLSHLVIVHDELDLEPGRVKLKSGGGLAGHNGLKSINAHLKSPEFVRIRIGVGKPPHPRAGADHVTKPVKGPARVELDIGVQIAADAIELIATQGLEAAMGEIHSRS